MPIINGLNSRALEANVTPKSLDTANIPDSRRPLDRSSKFFAQNSKNGVKPHIGSAQVIVKFIILTLACLLMSQLRIKFN